MSFTPLMTLLVPRLVDLLSAHRSVVELGNQTFNASDAALDAVLVRAEGHAGIELERLRALCGRVKEKRGVTTADYYRCLGFGRYDAIDINDTYGSLVMDLNQDLSVAYDFNTSYDLVTNNGTGEHIFDQATVLRNMHNLTNVNGIMVHAMPMLNYVNHGFYSFQPCLYYGLARANNYRLLGLALAHRRGTGVMAEIDSKHDHLPSFLLEEKRIALPGMLMGAKFGPKGYLAPLKRWRNRLIGSRHLPNRLGAAIAELGAHEKVMVVAVLRRLTDAPFRLPIQTLYAEDFSDPRCARATPSQILRSRAPGDRFAARVMSAGGGQAGSRRDGFGRGPVRLTTATRAPPSPRLDVDGQRLAHRSASRVPVIGRTQCQELKVLTKTTRLVGRELEGVQHLHVLEPGLPVELVVGEADVLRPVDVGAAAERRIPLALLDHRDHQRDRSCRASRCAG